MMGIIYISRCVLLLFVVMPHKLGNSIASQFEQSMSNAMLRRTELTKPGYQVYNIIYNPLIVIRSSLFPSFIDRFNHAQAGEVVAGREGSGLMGPAVCSRPYSSHI